MRLHRIARISILAVLAVIFFAGSLAAGAQDVPRVQALTGTIDPGGMAIYRLDGLEKGQRLDVYARPSSGNLDPIVSIITGEVNLEEYLAAFQVDVTAAMAAPDPIAEINRTRDKYALAWNDDGGQGYNAALEWQVPESDKYYLVVAGALSTLGRQTFGDYRLLIGLDEPAVLTGEAQPAGEPLAVLETDALPASRRVQTLAVALSETTPTRQLELVDFRAGDVLYVSTVPVSGQVKPAILLRDFGGKPLNGANLGGLEDSAALKFTFDEAAQNYTLELRGIPQGAADFTLLLGINAPEVLEDPAGLAATSLPVVISPIDVKIGVKLQQIIQINTQDEYYSMVGSLQMQWSDPALAFSPDTCQCMRKIYTEKEFDRFLADVEGRWPDFTLYNQQGNRWVQNRLVVLEPNGNARYFERFSTNLQVDFDFRQFPFDTQTFPVRVDMLYPESRYTFSDLEGFSEISKEHGEDEFIIEEFQTTIESEVSSTGASVSRFTFSFDAPRHLSYYLFRIFIPIALIIMISWWTFFLKDFNKRMEVAAGNILLFIAFSFSLAENYPRLGYLTFMDAIMAITFIINALTFIYNVYMRRLEVNGQIAKANRIDDVLDWAYPLIYVAAIGVAVLYFFT